MGGHDHVAVGIFLRRLLRPGERLVGGRELQRNEQQFLLPARERHQDGGVLQRGTSLAVVELGDEAVAERGALALEGEPVRVEGMDILGGLVAVIMVPGARQVGHTAVQALERAGDGGPHLPARLVEHPAVQGVVVVLLHQVAGAEDGLDAQPVHVVRDPGRADFEDALVDVVFLIALRIAQQDDGGAAFRGQGLRVGTVLRRRQDRQQRQQEKGQLFHREGCCRALRSWSS